MDALKVAAIVVAALTAAGQARAQLQISTPDGGSSIKFGLLAQPQGEWIGAETGDGTTSNLFLRRVRLLAGGTVGDRLSFFVDTDSPNLGKADAAGKKNADSVFIQDVILTYAVSTRLMVDAGLLLTPNSHNAAQGAATLLPIEYGPYAFCHSTPTGSRVGRDHGVQGRGSLASGHLEVRLGVFQGARDAGSRGPLRTVGRAVWYPFEAETGYFYSGTSFGKKRILAVGASYDRQDDYRAPAFDVYLDWPVGRNAVTAQVDLVRFDGGSFLASLPRQDTMHVEAGYYFASAKVGPFLQYNERDYADPSRGDERFTQVGVAYWHAGHTFDVKLGYGRFENDHAGDRSQIVLQAQLYIY